MPRVAVVVGSRSDLPTMEPCLETLKELGIDAEAQVMSAHRSPAKVQQFASSAAADGFEVIIAAAGMSAQLPGALAAWTTLPVIGVPIWRAEGSGVSGLDSLLSIVQMPPGIPVGCMAINGARNAALYAAAILALKYGDIREALQRLRKEQASA